MRDDDLLIMQHSALHIPHDYMVNTILHRFGILDWIADGMDATRGDGVQNQPNADAEGRTDRVQSQLADDAVGRMYRSPLYLPCFWIYLT
jgi:hypothetical protein